MSKQPDQDPEDRQPDSEQAEASQQPAGSQDSTWAEIAEDLADLDATAAAVAGSGEENAEASGKAQAAIEQLQALVAERTDDLQRVQAEYVNYKRRVDRDRSLAKGAGVESVVRDLMPVLDSVELSKAHGELVGGFKMVADELVRLAGKYGLVSFGEAGEVFDPRRHEALMQVPVPGTGEMTVQEVMQRGYELNGAVIRPARVIVAVPNGEQSAEGTSSQQQSAQQTSSGNESPGGTSRGESSGGESGDASTGPHPDAE